MFKKWCFLLIAVFLLMLPQYARAAEVNPFTQGYIEGYLLNISIITPDADTAENTGDKKDSVKEEPAPEEKVVMARIETYAGRIFQIEIHPQASFNIDNRPVGLHDFRPGMEVYGKITGSRLVSLEAYSTANMGYIEPGSKVRKGTVSKIDRNQIQLNIGEKTVSYYLSPATLVVKQGQVVPADVLYEGDRVKLYFDELNSDLVSRIEIEGNSILVNNLYKGNLQIIDTADNVIGLDDVEIFHNGKWQDYKPTLRITYTYELPLFTGGQRIPQQHMKYYRGKTAYLVTKSVLGRESIDRMIIKNQYESSFSDKIKDVNWYSEAFELSDNRNFVFNEGSIIIKNGRIQDKSALSAGSDAYVLADGWGGNRIANLIYIYNEEINNSNLGQHYLYAGRLDQIVEDKVWLKNYFMLNDNEWESYKNEKELFYDNDTSIYDLKKGSLVSVKEFYASDYAVDEDSDRVEDQGLKDWYAYVYTDGDRIAAIAAQKNMDSLLRQRITSGATAKLEDDSLTGWVLELREARDWSRNKEQWMPKSSNLKINLQKAMLIKNNKIIMAEDLKPGDRLYIIRDDYMAKVVIVK